MNRYLRRVGFITLALAFAPALAQSPALAQPSSQRNDIVLIQEQDPAMRRAVETARAELPAFFRSLANPGAGESNFAVKFDLAGSSEMIWAGNLRREGGRLTGTLSNVPMLAGFEMGQRVTIPESAIIDWAYLRGRSFIGHHTTRVLLGRMDADQAAQVRQALGW
jgi:uncharacterized protein YegJ (DUF2314 family)